jgi:hypothetical protein
MRLPTPSFHPSRYNARMLSHMPLPSRNAAGAIGNSDRAHHLKSFCLQILHWISGRRLYSLKADGGESN